MWSRHSSDAGADGAVARDACAHATQQRREKRAAVVAAANEVERGAHRVELFSPLASASERPRSLQNALQDRCTICKQERTRIACAEARRARRHLLADGARRAVDGQRGGSHVT